MNSIFSVAVVAAILAVAPNPCFALWDVHLVTKESAKELGMEVRSAAAGPNDVRVELEFKLEGTLKDFSRVDLRIGTGDQSVVAALKEDRSKEGRVVVSFVAHRDRLNETRLWVMLPGIHGGTIQEIRVKDFVEPK